VLPAVEMVAKSGLFDFTAMYTRGETEYYCPARLAPEVAAEVARLAGQCHTLLRCRDVSRADMVVDAGGRPWVLEVNTSPGMTETSLLPMAAEAAGLEFHNLVGRLVLSALRRRS
jgi:D-alanine-D-alanine ligase